MLERVEEAGLGIAAGALPAHDDGAGRLVELSVNLGVKAETGQPALHGTSLSPVEADLIFVFLSCFVGKGRRIVGYRQIAGGRAQTGFGSIRADKNSQDGQCEDQDTHGLFFPHLKVSMKTYVGSIHRRKTRTFGGV